MATSSSSCVFVVAEEIERSFFDCDAEMVFPASIFLAFTAKLAATAGLAVFLGSSSSDEVEDDDDDDSDDFEVDSPATAPQHETWK